MGQEEITKFRGQEQGQTPKASASNAPCRRLPHPLFTHSLSLTPTTHDEVARAVASGRAHWPAAATAAAAKPALSFSIFNSGTFVAGIPRTAAATGGSRWRWQGGKGALLATADVCVGETQQWVSRSVIRG